MSNLLLDAPVATRLSLNTKNWGSVIVSTFADRSRRNVGRDRGRSCAATTAAVVAALVWSGSICLCATADAQRVPVSGRVPKTSSTPAPRTMFPPQPLQLTMAVDATGKVIGQILAQAPGYSGALVTTGRINGHQVLVSIGFGEDGFWSGGGYFLSEDCTGPLFLHGTALRPISEHFWTYATALGAPHTHPSVSGPGATAFIPDGELSERTFESRSYSIDTTEEDPCPQGFVIEPATCCLPKTETRLSVPTTPLDLSDFVPPFSIIVRGAALAAPVRPHGSAKGS